MGTAMGGATGGAKGARAFGAAQLVAMPGVVGCDLDGAALVTKDSEIVQGGFSFVAGHIALV